MSLTTIGTDMLGPGTGGHDALLVAAILASGVLAGFFHAWHCALLPGLTRTDDDTFVTAMTAVNDAVRNPSFALIFFGAPLLTAAALLAPLTTGGAGTVLLGPAVAFVLHLAAFGVTAAANLPLNSELARSGRADRAAARRSFAAPWARWNLLRELLVVAAAVILGVTLATGTAP